MRINYTKMNTIISTEKKSEILTSDMRKDILWLAKEYRRLGNWIADKRSNVSFDEGTGVMQKECICKNYPFTAAEEKSIATVLDLRDYMIMRRTSRDLIEDAYNKAHKYTSIANERGSDRGYRRAMEKNHFAAPKYEINFDEIEEEEVA